MTAPTITAVFSFDTDQWTLMATSHGVCNPAGPRLFRGGDLPDVAWVHESEADAIRGAALLQAYVTAAWAGKAPRAKGREEAEQPKLTVWDLKNAVWCV